MEPIRVTEIMHPTSLRNPKPGIYVLDMGQAFYGVVRLKVSGPVGTRVEMRTSFNVRPDGLLKTENDRSARNKDVYILSGRGVGPRLHNSGGMLIASSRSPGFRERQHSTISKDWFSIQTWNRWAPSIVPTI